MCGWSSPNHCLDLKMGEVHVWRASLNLSHDRIRSLHRTLSADERLRAGRFHFARDRNRFVAARGTLRSILSRYLKITADRIRFQYNPFGKPSLAECHIAEGIEFNLAHSHDLALYAFSRVNQLGVDIEYMQAKIAFMNIVQDFFPWQEKALLRKVPKNERCKVFFECWTRREAYLKALGRGLSLTLDHFHVEPTENEDTSTLAVVNGNLRNVSSWFVKTVKPGESYIGALVVRKRPDRLRFWEWVHEPCFTVIECEPVY
jgi:4'-phosphopantetheinyl transferase